MQKIVIKNFGPVKDAEIEIKDILVLIGEQASGKSTIAKLIYFFKSLSTEFFNIVYKLKEWEKLTIEVRRPIKTKFLSLFGTSVYLSDFEITYYYSKDRYLSLKLAGLGNDINISVLYSYNFFHESFLSEIQALKREIKRIEERTSSNHLGIERFLLDDQKRLALQKISQLFDSTFGNHHTSSLYAIAGRETTVSYETTFEGYLELSLSQLIEEQRKNITEIKTQTIDENLMIDFLRETRRIKEVFKKYGGGFKELMTNFEEDVSISQDFLNKIDLILKGKYRIDELGEKILFQNGQFVYLKDGSSGQKEVIRILQDLVLSIIEKQNILRVIEEPEAHLFPVAQKQLMEVLVSMLNINPKNQLIITTHSPYILTVLNNLLFATRVIAKNATHKDTIEAYIPNLFHINPANFAAYSLGNSLIEDSEYCENIFNKKTGTIKQNYLDTVSDILGSDFQFLYNLHASTLRG